MVGKAKQVTEAMASKNGTELYKAHLLITKTRNTIGKLTARPDAPLEQAKIIEVLTPSVSITELFLGLHPIFQFIPAFTIAIRFVKRINTEPKMVPLLLHAHTKSSRLVTAIACPCLIATSKSEGHSSCTRVIHEVVHTSSVDKVTLGLSLHQFIEVHPPVIRLETSMKFCSKVLKDMRWECGRLDPFTVIGDPKLWALVEHASGSIESAPKIVVRIRFS